MNQTYVPDADAEMDSEAAAVCGSSFFSAAAAASDGAETTAAAVAAAETTAACGSSFFCAAAAVSAETDADAANTVSPEAVPGGYMRLPGAVFYVTASHFFTYVFVFFHIYNTTLELRWVRWRNVSLFP